MSNAFFFPERDPLPEPKKVFRGYSSTTVEVEDSSGVHRVNKSVPNSGVPITPQTGPTVFDGNLHAMLEMGITPSTGVVTLPYLTGDPTSDHELISSFAQSPISSIHDFVNSINSESHESTD